MAEILITGMEMPKDMSNPLHISIFSNGSVWITHEGKTEATAQELLPHGRLIDADALAEYYDCLEADNGVYMEEAGETLETIENAPTILEASK